MPFTISHAGFVLPLRKRLSARVLCGLMIGCVVPDFGYFIRDFGLASYAHTVMGALLFSVPVGFVIYMTTILCFRRIVAVLPDPHSGFLMTWDIHGKSIGTSLMTVLIAIFLGALSHNFADSFTHESGRAVSIFPVLASEAFIVGDEPFHVFRVLQYSGSLLGMVMIVSAYNFSLRRYCLTEHIGMWQDFRRWLLLLGVGLLTTVGAACLNIRFLYGETDLYALRAFGFKFLITWIPLFVLAFLCLAFFRPKSDSQNSQSKK